MNVVAQFLKFVAIFLLICSTVYPAFTQGNYDFECHHIPENYSGGSSFTPPTTDTFSFHGGLLTPRGSQKILIIYAGFTGYEGNDPYSLPGWDNHLSEDFQLPIYVDTLPDGTPTTTDFFFNAESDFNPGGPIDDPDNESVSKVLNIMSKPNEDFRFYGDVFTDPAGDPVLVTVDPYINPDTGMPYDTVSEIPRTWTQMNQVVLKRAAQINPGFDWYQYDQRTNGPAYVFDNSASPPDSILDYVVFIYRYDRGWDPQPVDTIRFPGDTIRNIMANWAGSGGGISGIGGNIVVVGTDTIDVNAGFTLPRGAGIPVKTFIHEMAHNVWNCPHFYGVNGVVGNYFYRHACGSSSTSLFIPFQPMLSGFERWYLNYIDAPPITTDGVYPLGDFLTSTEADEVALRIEIPFSGGQYLWIENHQNIHELDEHEYYNGGNTVIGPGQVTLPDSDAGLYMYVENVAPTHEDIYIFSSGANGFKPLNASGNWDFTIDTNQVVTNNWGHKLEYTQRIVENPVAGISPWTEIMGDFNESGTLEIGTHPNDPSGNHGLRIVWEDTQQSEKYLYRSWGGGKTVAGYNRSPAFATGDVISMGTNPTVLNYPQFDLNTQQLEPFMLNGLYVKVQNIDSQGNALIEVKFKQTGVFEDVRWTGNIVLPNITEDDNADLVLDDDKEILLDVSGTPNRQTIDTITNDFINPTTLTISNGSKLHLKDRARIRIKNNSTLVIEEGAEVLLEDYACIVVEETGTLHLKGNNIHLNGPNSVIILKGTLKTDDNVDFTFTGPGYLDVHPTNQIDMGDNSNFVIERPIVQNKERFINIRENTSLLITDRELRLYSGKVIYNGNSNLTVNNGYINTGATVFDGSGSADNEGLIGIDLTNCLIDHCEFYKCQTGSYITGNTTIPMVRNSFFKDNGVGAKADNMDHFILRGNNFVDNTQAGIQLEFIDLVEMSLSNSVHCGPSNWVVGGIVLDHVNAAWLSTSYVRYCPVGIRATASNVFLNNGTIIEYNSTGVLFENNETAEWTLTVGACDCASIINNDVGVSGENIVLSIDAIEHQQLCNNDELRPNQFNGNGQVFDICYNDPNYPSTTPILMKGNYWGPNPLSVSQNYAIQLSPCVSTSPSVPIDDSDAVTDPNSLYPCGLFGIQPPNPYPPRYPVAVLPKVRCDVVETGVTYEVHEQSRLAFADYYDENYPAALAGFQPVASLDHNVHNTRECVHKINFARCIVNGLESDQYATPYSEGWHAEATRNMASDADPVRITPNPTTSHLQLLGPTEQTYHLEVYDVMGRRLHTDSFQARLRLSVAEWQKGIYLFVITGDNRQQVQASKVTVF